MDITLFIIDKKYINQFISSRLNTIVKDIFKLQSNVVSIRDCAFYKVFESCCQMRRWKYSTDNKENQPKSKYFDVLESQWSNLLIFVFKTFYGHL